MQVTIDSACFWCFLRLWQLWGSPSRSWQGCPNSDSVRKFSHHGRFAGKLQARWRSHSQFPAAKPDEICIRIQLKIAWMSLLFPWLPLSFSLLLFLLLSTSMSLLSIHFLHLASPTFPPFTLPTEFSAVQRLHSPEREAGFIDKPGCFLLKQQWLWNRNYPLPHL